MRPDFLSAELRGETGAYLARRRAVVALKFAGAVSLGIVALYQTGVIPIGAKLREGNE